MTAPNLSVTLWRVKYGLKRECAKTRAIEPDEIGQRIKAARERCGWTQPVFAREANVSLSSVQRWERGELPPVRELIRLAGVLGIEADQLVELEHTAEDRFASLRDDAANIADRLQRLETLVSRHGKATTKAIEGVAERLERIEQLLGPRAGRSSHREAG